MNGTEWDVERIVKVVDGDTVHVIRTRIDQLGDTPFHISDVDPVSIRLVWVDTPERGTPGYKDARNDLAGWIESKTDPHSIEAWPEPEGLRVICYESAGWDRLLGDLIDADGNSASQWLMTERGWPMYEEGK